MKKFPLIQLLTVVAIVAVLAAVASPSFLHAGMKPKKSPIPAAPAAFLSGNAEASAPGAASGSDPDDSWGPVDPPDRPDGPTKGKVNKKLTYETEGTNMFNSHVYMFDWGDGSKKKWEDDEKQSHKYKKPGSYSIRVKESCPWKTFQTDWSKSRKVKISK